MGAGIVMLREGFEASLILGIVLAFLNRTGRREAFTPVWIGAAIAVFLSVFVGALLFAVGAELEGTAEAVFEGTAMILAAGLLTWMIFWMRSQARSIKKELEGQVEHALATGSSFGLAVVVFVVSIPVGMIAAPMERAILERALSTAGNLPPEVREAIENYGAQRSDLGFAGQLLFRIFSGFIFACIFLAANAGFAQFARRAEIEMALTAFCFLSLLSAYVYLFVDGRRRWSILSYALLGCALLTKGPVSLLLVTLPVLVFALIQRYVFGVGFRPLLDLIMVLVISGVSLFGFGFVGEMVAGLREEIRHLAREVERLGTRNDR